jgi:cystathionine gamma-synthase
MSDNITNNIANSNATSIATKCIHLDEDTKPDQYGAVSYPIYQSATFAHKGIGETTGYDYSRLQNPTRERVEKVVASLEGGIDALAFSSGMAAVDAMVQLFKTGDHIITDNDLYGGSIRLFRNIAEKNGVSITGIDFYKDAFDNDIIERNIRENTKALYIETPTNPMMNVTDIKKVAEIAKKHNLLFIVDNTFLTPYFQNPLSLGADIVIHSGTKYLGGHNDTISGFLVTSREDISERLRFIIKTTGAGLSPFDSWLTLRGIKTLAIRMEKAQKNAIKIANWLCGQRNVSRVIYPGLCNHAGYDIMLSQSRGFGAMLTFEVATKEFALNILKGVKLIQFAESLGGVETLITYPITQTHADVPKDQLDRNGITDRILRLSVGIENVDDLINDLSQAFKAAGL